MRLYEKVLPDLADLVAKTCSWLNEFAQAVRQNEKPPDGNDLLGNLDEFTKHLWGLRKASKRMFLTKGWMLVFNTLTALRFIVGDLSQDKENHRLPSILRPGRGDAPSLADRARRLADQFNLRSTNFRLALQGAAAAAAAMVLIKHFQLHYGYWVVIFAVLALKPNLGSALKSGKYRLIGTIIGVAAGSLFTIAGGSQ